MPDLSGPKSAEITYASKIAGQMLALADLCDEFTAGFFAKGFNSGGANPIADADCTGANAFLSAAIVSNVVTQAQLMSSTFTAAVRNTLRQAILTGQPPNLP